MGFSLRLCLITGYCVLKAVDSCMFILYPANLLNSLIIDSVGVSRFIIMSSAGRNSFTSVLQTLMPLINFSSLILLANTSSIMLNTCGDNDYPYLVLHLR